MQSSFAELKKRLEAAGHQLTQLDLKLNTQQQQTDTLLASVQSQAYQFNLLRGQPTAVTLQSSPINTQPCSAIRIYPKI